MTTGTTSHQTSGGSSFKKIGQAERAKKKGPRRNRTFRIQYKVKIGPREMWKCLANNCDVKFLRGSISGGSRFCSRRCCFKYSCQRWYQNKVGRKVKHHKVAAYPAAQQF